MPGTPCTPAASAAMRLRHLVAHDLDGLGRRADEGHAPLGDGPGEVGVLGEEPVAGVHAVGARLRSMTSRILLGVEVALGRGLTAEGVGLVGEADVQRVAVEIGVHGHGGDAQLLAGTDDTDSDLAPVGDQDLGEHAIWLQAMQGTRARSALGGTRFADVRWVAETGSTNDDLLALGPRRRARGHRPRRRSPDRGPGRLDRTWQAPPGRSLLMSILLRPALAAADAHLVVDRGGAAPRSRPVPRSPAVDAPAQVAERPGGGRRGRRRSGKLAGILAEAIVDDGRLRRRGGRHRPQRELAAPMLPDDLGGHRHRAQPRRRPRRRPRGPAASRCCSGSTTGAARSTTPRAADDGAGDAVGHARRAGAGRARRRAGRRARAVELTDDGHLRRRRRRRRAPRRSWPATSSTSARRLTRGVEDPMA